LRAAAIKCKRPSKNAAEKWQLPREIRRARISRKLKYIQDLRCTALIHLARWRPAILASVVPVVYGTMAQFPPGPYVAIAFAWTTALGCASGEVYRQQDPVAVDETVRDVRAHHVPRAIYAEDGSSSEMTMVGEQGTLNAADIESALTEHLGELRDCSGLDRGGQRAGGRLVVRFFVDGKGEVDDVAILKSSVGNHAIERCIADIAVGVVFDPPAGHKPMTFDYPIVFRPSHQLTAYRQRKR
jgi:TonB family protein